MAIYNYIISSGVIVPDTSEIKNEIQGEYVASFGSDIDLNDETPEGLQILAEAEARSAVAQNNATLANQINPNRAGGVFLDNIWALTGGSRFASKFSTVYAQIKGVPFSDVPLSVVADFGDINSPEFSPVELITLDEDGNGTLLFQCLTPGPIAVPVGTLNNFVTAPLGLETITNMEDGILGEFEESDVDSRVRRRQTLALQASGDAEAITSALNDSPFVKSNVFRENEQGVDRVVDGVLLLAHSMYVCVDGGTDQQIADILTRKKGTGTNYNGNVVVPYTNPYSGQLINVKFDRPTYIDILVRVTAQNSGSISNIVEEIKRNLIEYSNTRQGLTMGKTVSSFDLSNQLQQRLPGLYVQKLEIALNSVGPSGFSCDPIPINIFERARLLNGNIQVIIA